MPSVTRQTHPGRTRREDVERQVLEAVESLLAEGERFTSLPIGRIADRAGIGRTSFYFYFKDKSELLLALIESVVSGVLELAETWVGDVNLGLDDLDATVRAVITERRRHAALIDACVEVASYDPVVAHYWRTRVNRVAAALARRLRGAPGQASPLPPGTDPDITAGLLIWGVERLAAEHTATHPDADADDALATSIARTLWAVIAPGPEPRAPGAGSPAP